MKHISMKYTSIVLTILTLVMAMAIPSFGQDQGNGPSVAPKLEDMDVSQLLAYQKMLKQKSDKGFSIENLTPENVNKYAQMGKGIGVAINEGLGAVTKNVEQFAQTSAGKWLMILITWKVMGNDAVGLVKSIVRFAVGIGLLVIGVPFFAYIYRRNCVSLPMLSSETKVWWLTIKKEYKGMTEPIHDDAGPWGYAFCFAAYIGIVALIMFV